MRDTIEWGNETLHSYRIGDVTDTTKGDSSKMSSRLEFTAQNLWKIADGLKTVTRRDWGSERVHKDQEVYFTYRKPGMPASLMPLDQCPMSAVIIETWWQTLGKMTDEDARQEGCADLLEFKQLWISLHKEWEPSLDVFVIEFRVLVGVNKKLMPPRAIL